MFNVVHDASRTLVSKSIALSELDKHILLPRLSTHKFVTKATTTFALRIKQLWSETETRTKRKEGGGWNTFEFEFINFVAGFTPYPVLGHYINVKYYFPTIVTNIRKALLAVVPE